MASSVSSLAAFFGGAEQTAELFLEQALSPTSASAWRTTEARSAKSEALSTERAGHAAKRRALEANAEAAVQAMRRSEEKCNAALRLKDEELQAKEQDLLRQDADLQRQHAELQEQDAEIRRLSKRIFQLEAELDGDARGSEYSLRGSHSKKNDPTRLLRKRCAAALRATGLTRRSSAPAPSFSASDSRLNGESIVSRDVSLVLSEDDSLHSPRSPRRFPDASHVSNVSDAPLSTDARQHSDAPDAPPPKVTPRSSPTPGNARTPSEEAAGGPWWGGDIFAQWGAGAWVAPEPSDQKSPRPGPRLRRILSEKAEKGLSKESSEHLMEKCPTPTSSTSASSSADMDPASSSSGMDRAAVQFKAPHGPCQVEQPLAVEAF